MKTRWVGVLLGGLAGASLLAAACAPAAEPKPAQPQAPAVQQPKPAAEQPKPVAEQPKPAVPAKPKTSVSGIPLDPEAKFGGVLRASTATEGPTFSPWEEAAGSAFSVGQPITNMIVQFQTWGSLQDYESQAYLTVVPDLARSWEQSKDGLTWTFRFYEGVKFSDGVPFTCADAKWTLDAIRTGQGLRRSPRAIHFLAVSEIQCADDLTMVISLKRPKPILLEMAALPYNVVWPAHKYKGNEDEVRNNAKKIGTGPFAVKDWIPGEKTTFVRREDYWNKPLPYLDGIELQILASQAATTALRAGRLDIAGFSFGGVTAETLMKECKECQVFPRNVSGGFAPLHVNHQRPPWNTREIKDAINLAIDRPKMIKVGADGWGILPTSGLFFPGSYWEMPYERVKQIPGYNVEDPEGNKQRARDLLKEAGYRPGELELPLNVWSSVQRWAPPLLEDLEAVGFKVKMNLLETARNYDVLSSGDFNVHLHGFLVGHSDPDVVLYEHFYTGSDRNYGRYSNPEVDRLIDEMSVTQDREERRRKAWDIGEKILRDQAKFIIYYYQGAPILGGRVRGVMPHPSNLAFYGSLNRYEHVWLEEK